MQDCERRVLELFKLWHRLENEEIEISYSQEYQSEDTSELHSRLMDLFTLGSPTLESLVAEALTKLNLPDIDEATRTKIQQELSGTRPEEE